MAEQVSFVQNEDCEALQEEVVVSVFIFNSQV